MTYDIEIAEFNSAGIRSVAKEIGVTHMRFIGGGYSKGVNENGEATISHEGEADWYVGFYELENGDLVANTNGDPVWEEQDAGVFAELAESCDVEL